MSHFDKLSVTKGLFQQTVQLRDSDIRQNDCKTRHPSIPQSGTGILSVT